jgi:hypothetical protein
LKRLHWFGTPRLLVDMVFAGNLEENSGGRSQRSWKNMERSEKTDSQHHQMEEFHDCPMLQKELHELMMNDDTVPKLLIRKRYYVLFLITHTHSLFPYYPVEFRMWKSQCINSELINNSTRYYVINYNYR